MKHLYGEFSVNQMIETKESLRKSIFFLLLIVDPKTCSKYETISVDNTFLNLLYKLSGLNSILGEPPEIVMVLSLLQQAWTEYQKKDDFNFQVYRKLVLDAGNEVLKIKEE